MQEYAGFLTALIQLGGFIIGGIIIAVSMRNNLSFLQREVVDLKLEIKKLGDILTTLAVQETRLDYMDRQIDDLRHGRGRIVETTQHSGM
jgi:hypothetical protein